MKRWDSFRKWLLKRSCVAVRVLERGEKGAFHFHLVTPQRWDVNAIRKAAPGYGIGRVHVKAVPVEAASYVAKYLWKGDRRWVPRGVRLWGCLGFEGASKQALKYVETKRIVVADTADQKLWTVLEWWDGDTLAFRLRRYPYNGTPDEIKKMELKPAQQKEVISKLLGGAIVAVGEFRGAVVRTQKWKDPRTSQEKSGVVTEYSVELGGMARKVTDWAEDGVKEADVKLPNLHRGDVVQVLVNGAKWFKGEQSISGKVVALPALV